MIVDTSAVLSVLFGEPDAQRHERAIAGAPRCLISVASLLEATIVLESRSGAAVGHDLGFLLEEAQIRLAPVTPDQAEAERRAWRRFGKGNHTASLSFRNRFSHALTEATR